MQCPHELLAKTAQTPKKRRHVDETCNPMQMDYVGLYHIGNTFYVVERLVTGKTSNIWLFLVVKVYSISRFEKSRYFPLKYIDLIRLDYVSILHVRPNNYNF